MFNWINSFMFLLPWHAKSLPKPEKQLSLMGLHRAPIKEGYCNSSNSHWSGLTPYPSSQVHLMFPFEENGHFILTGEVKLACYLNNWNSKKFLVTQQVGGQLRLQGTLSQKQNKTREREGGEREKIRTLKKNILICMVRFVANQSHVSLKYKTSVLPTSLHARSVQDH